MDKREFLKKASLAAVLTTFGLTMESCSDDEAPDPINGMQVEVDLTVSPFPDLQQDGGWVLHPDKDILLVNVGGSISAFSSRCTHTGCTRNWSFNGHFNCSCHGSSFDTAGNVTSGPASGPLTRIAVSRNGNILTLG